MKSIFNFNSDRFDVRMGFDLSIFNIIEEEEKQKEEEEEEEKEKEKRV